MGHLGQDKLLRGSSFFGGAIGRAPSDKDFLGESLLGILLGSVKLYGAP